MVQLKFTDKQLVNLYKSLVSDYKASLKYHHFGNEFDKYQAIYSELYSKFCLTLFHDQTLKNLPLTEQEKAWSVFYSVLYAQSGYLNLSREDLTVFREWRLEKIRFDNSFQYYNSSNDLFFTGFLLGAVSSHNYNQGLSNNMDNSGEGLAALVVILVAVLVVALTFVAAYYILVAGLNSMERLVYNEDWFKATLTLGSIIGGAAAGACLGYFVIAPLILGLAISNPVLLTGLGIASIVCLSIIFSAGITFAVNKIQNAVIEKVNPDALDPKDPYRFLVHEDKLKGYNIETVKCAIVALRLEMDSERVPSLLSRWNPCASADKEQIQRNLQLIRQLRNGEYPYDTITVGDMTFHLRMPSVKLYYENIDDLPIYEPIQPLEFEPVYQSHHFPGYSSNIS